ncbi:hypothetical protein B0T14DRAFT_490020 [Immersiella caudata]|uniref:Uncharacterized protein n=1 Tax=Immersiella caudata TaxID=314043 RepID=A0AA39XCM0_9PEZI|nr:hypothetical protein B0T14DRAFT_490020 [Immersiella caudata]
MDPTISGTVGFGHNHNSLRSRMGRAIRRVSSSLIGNNTNIDAASSSVTPRPCLLKQVFNSVTKRLTLKQVAQPVIDIDPVPALPMIDIDIRLFSPEEETALFGSLGNFSNEVSNEIDLVEDHFKPATPTENQPLMVHRQRTRITKMGSIEHFPERTTSGSSNLTMFTACESVAGSFSSFHTARSDLSPHGTDSADSSALSGIEEETSTSSVLADCCDYFAEVSSICEPEIETAPTAEVYHNGATHQVTVSQTDLALEERNLVIPQEVSIESAEDLGVIRLEFGPFCTQLSVIYEESTLVDEKMTEKTELLETEKFESEVVETGVLESSILDTELLESELVVDSNNEVRFDDVFRFLTNPPSAEDPHAATDTSIMAESDISEETELMVHGNEMNFDQVVSVFAKIYGKAHATEGPHYATHASTTADSEKGDLYLVRSEETNTSDALEFASAEPLTFRDHSSEMDEIEINSSFGDELEEYVPQSEHKNNGDTSNLEEHVDATQAEEDNSSTFHHTVDGFSDNAHTFEHEHIATAEDANSSIRYDSNEVQATEGDDHSTEEKKSSASSSPPNITTSAWNQYTTLNEQDMKLFHSTHPNAASLLNGELPEGGDSYFSGYRQLDQESDAASHNQEDDNISTCSYRSCKSIMESAWAQVSFIDEDGHIDTYANAEMRGENGRLGRLHKCTWALMPRTQTVARVSNVPQLVLITPDREECGLEDMNYYPCANAWADMDSEEE